MVLRECPMMDAALNVKLSKFSTIQLQNGKIYQLAHTITLLLPALSLSDFHRQLFWYITTTANAGHFRPLGFNIFLRTSACPLLSDLSQ